MYWLAVLSVVQIQIASVRVDKAGDESYLSLLG